MRAKEFIVEIDTAPIQPIAGTAPATKPAEEKPTAMTPIILGLRQVAANKPTFPTGNPGVDNLLFKVANLSSGPGGVVNALAKGMSSVGDAFASQTSMARANFGYQPRKGSDIAKGIPKAGATTVDPVQAKFTGVHSMPKDIANRDQIKNEIMKAATPSTDPRVAAPGFIYKSTKNSGIDSLLDYAGGVTDDEVAKMPQVQPDPNASGIEQDIAG